MHRIALFLLFVVAMLLVAAAPAGENDVTPNPGTFPTAGMGVYLAGELVSVDHVNRRGALRLVGDFNDDRYHAAPSHVFAMLPYGTIRYHGAPAELRDIPIGTVLHGTFLLPPAGDTTFPQPPKNARYVVKQTHALSLEDDFSFYQRTGRPWKLTSVKLRYDASSPDYPPTHKNGTWRKTFVLDGMLTASGPEPPANGTEPLQVEGLSGEQRFTIDRSTRLWKGQGLIEWEDLAEDAVWTTANNERSLKLDLDGALLNLSWAPEWKNRQFHVTDVWLDEASRQLAAERQRQVHLRQQRTRWLAGWVDHVEQQGGGKGIVTVTLFGGMDPSLYEAARAQAKPGGGASLAAAEWTLRSWWQDHDNKNGPVLDYKDVPNPPPGSSGLQLRVQIRELLEGFRSGRIVRFRPNGFPNVKLPPEERVKGFEER